MLKAGASSKIITNELGTPVQGATSNQVAESIRDELEANVFFLSSEETRVMFINCDVGLIDTLYARRYCNAISAKTGIPERNIIISGTHTHSGPSVLQTSPFKKIDEKWLNTLEQKLVDAAWEAVTGAAECRIGYAKGTAQIGYNRRCCWNDGTHSMHGDTTLPGFTGLEGPQDSTHLVLYAENMGGQIIGIVHNNSCHTVNFYGAAFYSADYPGYARQLIRDAVGKIPVLYFNGGFGDNAPRNLLVPGHGNGESVMKKQSCILAGETLRLIAESRAEAVSDLKHSYEDLSVPIRFPDQGQLENDKAVVRRVMSEGRIDMESLLSFGRCRLAEEYSDKPFDTVPVHAVKIGDLAVVTNPCELYGQFMIDLRRRSPAELTMFADISDGYCGYCPTMYGVLGGGYSGESIHWTRLAADAGYRIVDTASKLLHGLWRSSSPLN